MFGVLFFLSLITCLFFVVCGSLRQALRSLDLCETSDQLSATGCETHHGGGTQFDRRTPSWMGLHWPTEAKGTYPWDRFDLEEYLGKTGPSERCCNPSLMVSPVSRCCKACWKQDQAQVSILRTRRFLRSWWSVKAVRKKNSSFAGCGPKRIKSCCLRALIQNTEVNYPLFLRPNKLKNPTCDSVTRNAMECPSIEPRPSYSYADTHTPCNAQTPSSATGQLCLGHPSARELGLLHLVARLPPPWWWQSESSFHHVKW